MFKGSFKNVTNSEIHFQVSFDHLAKIELVSISLYKGKTLIKELENLNEKKFTNLEENTKYKIKITYLKEGKIEELFLETITLASPVTVLEQTFLTEDYYLDEKKEDLWITFDNSSNLNIKTIYINHQKTKIISKKNQTKYRVSLDLKHFYAKTKFKVTKIEYETQKVILSQDVKTNISSTKYILGEINAKSIKEKNASHYLLRSSDATFKLVLDNKSKYKIKAISLRINNEVQTFNENEIKIIDDENIEITYLSSKSWSSYLTVSVFEILYDNFKEKTVNKQITFVYTSLYRVKSLEVKNISSITDLQSLENGYIYRLTTDIDGSGFQWIPYEFVGVILGNGYSINNISIDFDDQRNAHDIGLFSEFKGVIERVSFNNFKINVKTDKTVIVGGIAGRSYRPLIMKNIKATNFEFNIINANEVTLGSLVGYQDKYGSFENIVIEDVKIIINKTNDARVGGILGFSDSYNVLKEALMHKLIINIEADSEVYLGTLMGYSYRNDIHRTLVTKSYLNVDTITGLFAYSESFIGAGFQTILHNIFLSEDVTIIKNKTENIINEENLVISDDLDKKSFYLKSLIFKEEDWYLANLNYSKQRFPKLKAFIKEGE